MGLAALVTIFLLLSANGVFETNSNLFLLPWIFALGVVMTIPSAILFYQGKFSFANPIVFATWSYFFPAFVIGGIFFAGGWSQPHFVYLIQDAKDNLPLTIVLIGIGFAGLAIGYFLPLGAKIGSLIADRLPVAAHPIESYMIPGTVLLILGVLNTIGAFSLGLFGYQKAAELNSYDGLIFVTTFYWAQASFLLWYVIFREGKKDILYIPVIFLLVLTSIAKAVFAGSRGTVLQIAIIVGLAYILSGRRFRLKQLTLATALLTAGMIAGMIYGTTFRQVKGDLAQQGAGVYSDTIVETVDKIGRSDLGDSIAFGFSNLAERIDIVSTVAVVVSSYEQLKPYEEAYGLDNNIWVDTTTFFIPRIVWNDKPTASDPKRYSELYFNSSDSSFAITPIGDLVRNFGIPGVPIGMFILGIILRIIYRALVEGQEASIWRLTLYFMLLTSVSYEGFYGLIVPIFFKFGFIAVIGILLVNFIAKRIDGRRSAMSLNRF